MLERANSVEDEPGLHRAINSFWTALYILVKQTYVNKQWRYNNLFMRYCSVRATELSGVFIPACKPCRFSTGCVLFIIYICLNGGFCGGAVVQGNATSLGQKVLGVGGVDVSSRRFN